MDIVLISDIPENFIKNTLVVDQYWVRKGLNLKSKDLEPSARVILAKLIDISESQSRPRILL